MINKISAVIITYNEERNIGRCLQSLQGIADEIVVVDSFSTDSSEKICESYKVRFFQRKWDNYSAQKNFGNEQASNDYILSIDADEVVSEKLQQSILSAKENLNADAFSMNRLTYYCGKPIRHCGWYPDKKVRLWNRNKGSWKGDVHEKISFEPDISISWLKGDLLHFTYQTFFEHIEKVNKYSEIMAATSLKKNKSSNIFLLIFKPAYKFLWVYFVNGGFLDGYEGFLISKMYAFDAFLRISKMRMMKSKQ